MVYRSTLWWSSVVLLVAISVALVFSVVGETSSTARVRQEALVDWALGTLVDDEYIYSNQRVSSNIILRSPPPPVRPSGIIAWGEPYCTGDDEPCGVDEDEIHASWGIFNRRLHRIDAETYRFHRRRCGEDGYACLSFAVADHDLAYTEATVVMDTVHGYLYGSGWQIELRWLGRWVVTSQRNTWVS